MKDFFTAHDVQKRHVCSNCARPLPINSSQDTNRTKCKYKPCDCGGNHGVFHLFSCVHQDGCGKKHVHKRVENSAEITVFFAEQNGVKKFFLTPTVIENKYQKHRHEYGIENRNPFHAFLQTERNKQ